MLTVPVGDRATVTRVPATAPRTEDHALCMDLLPLVSRTFALSIAALPPELRDAVGAAYLLCRVVDTVEDTPGVPVERRLSLFAELTALLVDETRPPERFALDCAAGLGQASEAERELCGGGLPALFRLFRSLPSPVRWAILPSVLEMARGMRLHVEQASEQGALRFESLAALERYCYFVAGTVGELLTRLFVHYVGPPEAAGGGDVRRDAVAFGIGLQLVNVVKDIAVDLERGDCFVPAELLDAEGIAVEQLLRPQHRDAALRVVRRLCARARELLAQAARYTACWPLPDGMPVRAFCAVPLAFAYASLKRVEQGEDTLRAGQTPKIERDAVARLWSAAHDAVQSDPQLAAWLAELAE
jgi:farnesyl-diphosphate farnesyltransferase